jgi:hypothetical protein
MVNQKQKQQLLPNSVQAPQKKVQDAKRKQLVQADDAICINLIK